MFVLIKYQAEINKGVYAYEHKIRVAERRIRELERSLEASRERNAEVKALEGEVTGLKGELAKKEDELKHARLDQKMLRDLGIEAQAARSELSEKERQLSVAQSEIEEHRDRVTALESSNKDLSAFANRAAADFKRANVLIAQMQKSAKMIKAQATRSGRKAASAKYRSIISKYQAHLAAREKKVVIVRRLDQCRAAAGVLEDVVAGELDDATEVLQEAKDDIAKFTADLSADPLPDLAGAEDVIFTPYSERISPDGGSEDVSVAMDIDQYGSNTGLAMAGIPEGTEVAQDVPESGA